MKMSNSALILLPLPQLKKKTVLVKLTAPDKPFFCFGYTGHFNYANMPLSDYLF